MTPIQSNILDAQSFSGDLKNTGASAGALPAVSPASQVSVTINQDCTRVYGTAVTVFEGYQTVSNRDSGTISAFAEKLGQVDAAIAQKAGG